MAGKYVDLTKEQKEEIRRLTQFANRRIASAFKEYEKAGLKLAPADVTGGIQTRQQWDSEKYAISRSVKFASQKEYREQLHWLRQFEHMRPSMTEYTKFQREKTLAGVETSFGTDVPVVLSDMINKLSAPDLTKFWKKFSLMSAKMGLKYGSDAAMQQAIIEFFGEDRQDLAKGLAVDLRTNQLMKAKQPKTTSKKAPAKKKPKKKRAKKKASKKNS